MSDAKNPAAGEPFLAAAVLLRLESQGAEAVLLIGELRGLTGWSEQALCGHIGCKLGDVPAPPEPEEKARLKVEHSVAFLRWVTKMARKVDRQADVRDIVVGAYVLCAGADGTLDGRVARCEKAMDVISAGTTGYELIGLGEISRAFTHGALALGEGRAYRNAVRLSRLTGELDDLGPHINPRRMAWLTGGNAVRAEHLGLNVAANMDTHMHLCELCARAGEAVGVIVDTAASAA